jgi:hypothetical protein
MLSPFEMFAAAIAIISLFFDLIAVALVKNKFIKVTGVVIFSVGIVLFVQAFVFDIAGAICGLLGVT